MLKSQGFVHPENKKGNGVIHPFTSKQAGRFYPDFYTPKNGTKLSEELTNIILDAKYKNFDEHNPPADDIAQMISYIHVMNASVGKFVYPSKNKTETGSQWTIRPFAQQTAEMMTKPFYISQEAKTYSDFVEEIRESEEMLTI